MKLALCCKVLKWACLHLPCLSFQEPLEEEDEDEKGPNPPMMVPVADILNHMANHNANLEYSPVSAELLCQASGVWFLFTARPLGAVAQQGWLSECRAALLTGQDKRVWPGSR